MRIELVKDQAYAPGCYLIVAVANNGRRLRYKRDFEENSVLIQTDYDYPAVANAFGWDGAPDDIEGAAEWLSENVGARAEDPGYF